jgi:hypothetical protein
VVPAVHAQPWWKTGRLVGPSSFKVSKYADVTDARSMTSVKVNQATILYVGSRKVCLNCSCMCRLEMGIEVVASLWRYLWREAHAACANSTWCCGLVAARYCSRACYSVKQQQCRLARRSMLTRSAYLLLFCCCAALRRTGVETVLT